MSQSHNNPPSDEAHSDQNYIRVVAIATGLVGGTALLVLAVLSGEVEAYIIRILLLAWGILGAVLSLLIRLLLKRGQKLETEGIQAAQYRRRADRLDDIRFMIIENIFTPLNEPARRREDIHQVWRILVIYVILVLVFLFLLFVT